MIKGPPQAHIIDQQDTGVLELRRLDTFRVFQSAELVFEVLPQVLRCCGEPVLPVAGAWLACASCCRRGASASRSWCLKSLSAWFWAVAWCCWALYALSSFLSKFLMKQVLKLLQMLLWNSSLKLPLLIGAKCPAFPGSQLPLQPPAWPQIAWTVKSF